MSDRIVLKYIVDRHAGQLKKFSKRIDIDGWTLIVLASVSQTARLSSFFVPLMVSIISDVKIMMAFGLE